MVSFLHFSQDRHKKRLFYWELEQYFCANFLMNSTMFGLNTEGRRPNCTFWNRTPWVWMVFTMDTMHFVAKTKQGFLCIPIPALVKKIGGALGPYPLKHQASTYKPLFTHILPTYYSYTQAVFKDSEVPPPFPSLKPSPGWGVWVGGSEARPPWRQEPAEPKGEFPGSQKEACL